MNDSKYHGHTRGPRPWDASHPQAKWYVDGDGRTVRFRIERGGNSTDGYVQTIDTHRTEDSRLNRTIARMIVNDHNENARLAARVEKLEALLARAADQFDAVRVHIANGVNVLDVCRAQAQEIRAALADRENRMLRVFRPTRRDEEIVLLFLAVVFLAILLCGCADHADPTEPLVRTPAPSSPFYVQPACSGTQPRWIVTNQGPTMTAPASYAIVSAGGSSVETGTLQLVAGQGVGVQAWQHTLSTGEWTLALTYAGMTSRTPTSCP